LVGDGIFRTARGQDLSENIAIPAAVLVFATMGALIASRVPRHPTGWIYLLGSLGVVVGALAEDWTDLARTAPAVPDSIVAWWFKEVMFVPSILVLTTLPLLLFPDGKLPSRRWRTAGWTAVAAIVFVSARPALWPGTFGGDAAKPVNPLGVPGSKPALDALNSLGLLVLGLVVIATIVSLFIRFRRATGAQRQQLKWLSWAGVWTIAMLFMAGPGTYGLGPHYPHLIAVVLYFVAPALFGVAITLIPMATAVAVLRYRLWDIDRIVSRSVTYAIVTAVLIAFYALLAVVLPTALLAEEDTPDWVVAVATLLVAAASGPLRRRVQSAVDRRFNRDRYDAARTIDGFSARLRQHVDLDTLAVELEGVVDRTMHPQHLFLWVAR
jgi:hypothetical protein